MGIKKNKKLLSLTDLYNFYVNNNQTVNFNAKESGESIVVQMHGSINFAKNNNDDKHREGLRPFQAIAYHDHVNLNKSEIYEDVFEENTKSAPFRPILANIVIDEDGNKDFGSHDYHIEKDSDGNEIVVYDEQPVGVISTEYSIVYDEQAQVNRAILNGFLYEGYCQDAIDILERRGETSCSVELNIRELAYNNDNKTLLLNDYYIGGLTFLGASHAPGMKNSKATLGDFSAEKNSICNFTEEENSKLIETLEKLNLTLSNFTSFNINNKDEQIAQKGGNDLENNKLNELMEKYNVTVEDVTFETEGLSDEELEKVFETTFGEVVEEVKEAEVEEKTEAEQEEFSKTCPECGATVDDDTTVCPECDKDLTEVPENEDDKDDFEEEPVIKEQETTPKVEPEVEEVHVEEEKFTKTFDLSHDDIRCALYQILAPYEEANNEYYWIVEVFDDYFVYQGCCGNYFGQKYVKEDETVSFDGEPYTLYSEFLTESERVALKEMRANYSVIEEELNKYKEAETKAQKEEILNDVAYAEFAEEDCMKEVIAKAYEYSVQELRDAMDLALAKAYKSKKTFSVEVEEKKQVKVEFTYEEVDDGDPYSDYFRSLKK